MRLMTSHARYLWRLMLTFKVLRRVMLSANLSDGSEVERQRT